MNKEHEIELKNEIAHIFDGVLNEIRIFEMVKDFIHKRYEAINYTHYCEELKDDLQFERKSSVRVFNNKTSMWEFI
jgi:hypothetical protein